MRVSRLLATLVLTLVVGVASEAQEIVLDFDSVSAPSGGCVDGGSYLSAHGITFVSISGGASPVICESSGTATTPTSPPNVFYAIPAVTNTNESYDLVFSIPLVSLTFTRSTINPVTALPPWRIDAYDAAGNVLSSFAKPGVQFPGPPAEVVTLAGPGIKRVRVQAFNSAHVTYNHPPFDDLTLVVPHPTCTYGFSGGSGDSFAHVCLTANGNLAELSGPAGQEHLGVDQVLEGYVVCSGTSVQSWDLIATADDFGPPAVVAGPTATGVTIQRLSSQFLLAQTFKLDKTNRAVVIAATLTNISGAQIPDVRLVRAYDPDVNGNANDSETKSTRSVIALDTDAVVLTGSTWATPTDTAINTGPSPACSPGSASSAVTGDASLASVTYRLGNMKPGAKKKVSFVYRIQ
jgi:hypothetical protein